LDSTIEIAPVPASNISDSFQQQVWRISMESRNAMGGETLGVDDGLHSFKDLLWFEYDASNTRLPDNDTGTAMIWSVLFWSVLITHVITCTRTHILASAI
jgi:hypothetical protein